MDDVRTIDAEQELERDYPATAEPAMDAPPAIGGDERRMHVRAYNHWVSLLDGRAYPSIADLDPASIADFGAHSVLLDFTAGPTNPAIPFLGRALREEGGHEQDIETIADVPARSLISRLTDHYLQIIANRAPIGFEAEFVNRGGLNTFYRGILMPFSSNGEAIDFIYGVINWKVAADTQVADALTREVQAALRAAPTPPPRTVAVWADGPNAAPRTAQRGLPAAEDDDSLLADRLAAARETAEAARTADARSRSALYRALGLAYDFALVAHARPADYAELLEDAGLKSQARAPMTPIVKLVFGHDYDKTRLTEFAAALSYAWRNGLGVGMLQPLLESRDGGLKGIVAAERAARRPATRPDGTARARTRLAAAPVRALDAEALGLTDLGEGFVLLLARLDPLGALGLIGAVEGDSALVDRAVRRMAA